MTNVGILHAFILWQERNAVERSGNQAAEPIPRPARTIDREGGYRYAVFGCIDGLVRSAGSRNDDHSGGTGGPGT